MDYKLPYDVTLDVEFNVTCSRERPSGYYYIKIANAYGYDFTDLLGGLDRGNLRDIWCTRNAYDSYCLIEIPIKFEVTFAAKAEIENVSLNGIDINDIVSPGMAQELINEAEKMEGI